MLPSCAKAKRKSFHSPQGRKEFPKIFLLFFHAIRMIPGKKSKETGSENREGIGKAEKRQNHPAKNRLPLYTASRNSGNFTSGRCRNSNSVPFLRKPHRWACLFRRNHSQKTPGSIQSDEIKNNGQMLMKPDLLKQKNPLFQPSILPSAQSRVKTLKSNGISPQCSPLPILSIPIQVFKTLFFFLLFILHESLFYLYIFVIFQGSFPCIFSSAQKPWCRPLLYRMLCKTVPFHARSFARIYAIHSYFYIVCYVFSFSFFPWF